VSRDPSRVTTAHYTRLNSYASPQPTKNINFNIKKPREPEKFKKRQEVPNSLLGPGFRDLSMDVISDFSEFARFICPVSPHARYNPKAFMSPQPRPHKESLLDPPIQAPSKPGHQSIKPSMGSAKPRKSTTGNGTWHKAVAYKDHRGIGLSQAYQGFHVFLESQNPEHQTPAISHQMTSTPGSSLAMQTRAHTAKFTNPEAPNNILNQRNGPINFQVETCPMDESQPQSGNVSHRKLSTGVHSSRFSNTDNHFYFRVTPSNPRAGNFRPGTQAEARA
jgi:hypothetical protein